MSATTLKQSDITPERIIETAKRQGISLKPGVYRNTLDHCGCPVAVLAMEINPSLKGDSGWPYERTLSDAGVSRHFIRGLVDGFDGYKLEADPDLPGDYAAAHAIGRATRIKVDPAFAADASKGGA